MQLKRRIALKSIVVSAVSAFFMSWLKSLSFSNKKTNSKLVFQVRYQCKKLGEHSGYFEDRSKWGDVAAVKAISDRYAQSGDLIQFEFKDTDTHLSWIYSFKDMKAFDKWNNEVFYTGAFNSLNIDPNYNFQMDYGYTNISLKSS